MAKVPYSNAEEEMVFKFDITKHKRYKELSDFDEANLFDVEAFLSTKLKMKKSQIVETYEMGVVEDDA